jgi:WhiB family redox-sensing transcriptional regulator
MQPTRQHSNEHTTRHHRPATNTISTSKETTMNTIQLQPVDETLVSTVAVARCADGNGTLTPLFFSDHVLDIARAKAICARCALAESCLSDALEREEPWGVWGGELLSGGRIVANKRPGGRPPKRPQPPVIVDEFGVVEPGDEPVTVK